MMYQTGMMTIDDELTIEGYYIEGELWNGFQTPRFKLDAALEWLEATAKSEEDIFGESIAFDYNPVARLLTVTPIDGWPDEYKVGELEGYLGLFVSLGAYSWCWSLVN